MTTVFGGAEIDLRDVFVGEGASLDLASILGGANIRVPEDVQVEISGSPILGGWENKTKVHEKHSDLPVLKINCMTILGGAEIQN
ncbi:hypothetical protein SAMN05216238_11610 [Lentibacillus persicus]|uniref:Cell wall-active antibiotics response 4TMS YvqF n=1 Tax=Lentibacillus persicus TaxID=640948 RepID=A0A1I2AKR4_9BACI|nr:hypothetical protein SAMN05216238_11610 [Lentibacillus persicus]